MSNLVKATNINYQNLADLITNKKSWLVITGAGISLSSGIPTYRDDKGNWLRSDPIKHQEFILSEAKRKRYWARSAVGWPPVQAARPNKVHKKLAKFEQQDLFSGLITQNVDRLHQRAGHQKVIDLHGRLDRVKCLTCGQYEAREQLQNRLIERNPFLKPLTADLAPDGDAYVEDEITEQIQIVNCLTCNGILMPDVVFFGGTIARDIHQQTAEWYKQSAGILVLGSSLMVYSGYRFCKQAHLDNKPVVIINRGKTRADDIATIKVEENCEVALNELEKTITFP